MAHFTEKISQSDIVAQILAKEFPNRGFSTPTFIGQGAVSAVYRADLEKDFYAVKIHTASQGSISEYELKEYEREQYWLIRAAAAGIPCPHAMAVGWHDNTAYSIQTFIVGVNGLESPVSPLAIREELGRLARLIHKIPVDDAEAKWHNYCNLILASLTRDDVKITLGIYAAHQQDALRHIFLKLAGLPLRYGLNHCDLNPRNTVVAPDGRVFLLDWGAASRDINIVPHAELASLLWELDTSDDAFRAFVRGYGLSEAEFAALLPEVLAIDLIGCFWFSENPPTSAYGHELVAHAKGLVFDHLPMLSDWASH